MHIVSKFGIMTLYARHQQQNVQTTEYCSFDHHLSGNQSAIKKQNEGVSSTSFCERASKVSVYLN